MSDYRDNAHIAKQQLDNISDTMCYAKWAQVSLHLTNGKTHSCYHPPTHDINVEEIKHDPAALHNTQFKQRERDKMLRGERPEGCSYCWRIEDAGGTSDRIYRSGEYWAQNARKDIITSTRTNKMNPRYVEVNFNQACNFKCVYCSPHLSTTWEEEIKEFGPYTVNTENGVSKHNDIIHLEKDGLMPKRTAQKDNPYVQAFWQWWPELYKTLEVFRMTGGEPLMDVNTFKVLDYIYENPNAWLELSITTNACPPREELWTKFMDKVRKLEQIQIWEGERFNPGSGNHWYVNMAVKNLALFVSVDSIGEQAEYARTGLDFEILNRNVHEFLSETVNTTVTFINTFNILSMNRFTDYLEYILRLREKYSKAAQGVKYIDIYDPHNTHPPHEIHPRQRIWFDVPLLRSPDWLAINNLSQDSDDYLTEAIEYMEAHSDTSNFVGFYDFEIDKVKRNLEWMRTERQNMTQETRDLNNKNLKNYLSQVDERRNTDYTKTFPEL